SMNKTMIDYARVAKDPNTLVVKYEDYIFEKGALLRAIADHFGWTIDEMLIGLILEWADVRPDEENPVEFIRKVTPGDHREKLKRKTIRAMNFPLRPAMRLFGYR